MFDYKEAQWVLNTVGQFVRNQVAADSVRRAKELRQYQRDRPQSPSVV